MDYYDNTEWGRFYYNYKDMTQCQLQKGILKFENERKRYNLKSNPCEITSEAKRIFHHTREDENGEYITPPELLKDKVNGKYNWQCVEATDKQRKKAKEYFRLYFTRQTTELEEVKAFYETRKAELAEEQREAHREKAREDVECPNCGRCVTRTNLSKHRKSKVCLNASKV